MISLDTKRFLRKKKFWIAIVSVIVVALVNFGYSGRGGGNHFDNLYGVHNSSFQGRNAALESFCRFCMSGTGGIFCIL